MTPNREYIADLMKARGWSQSKLAMKMSISRSEVSRFFKGKRIGGKKLQDGLLRAFPGEDIHALFILPKVSPIVNDINNIQSIGKHSGVPPPKIMMPIKHPEAHQLACSIDEESGMVEIMCGRCVTTLLVPPGPIKVRHTTRQNRQPDDTS